MLPGMRYTTERLSLEPGSSLLLYTDGLTEVFRGEEEFGEDRLLETFRNAHLPLHENDPQRAEAALDSLWTTLDTFTGGAPQQDDMSAIALFRLSSAPRTSGNTGFSVISKENA
jgi:serine phosphatase RsbU (regulator of sigma subunit)